MKKLITIVVAISLFVATMATGAMLRRNCTLVCMQTQRIVQSMTTSTTAQTVSENSPNNHNWQEYALSSEKTYELENPADYMEGLTAYSKRTIYVGDADRRFCAKLNL